MNNAHDYPLAYSDSCRVNDHHAPISAHAQGSCEPSTDCSKRLTQLRYRDMAQIRAVEGECQHSHRAWQFQSALRGEIK